MAALPLGPPDLVPTLTKHAQSTNMLPLGDDNNVAFGGAQLNVAPAQKPTSRASHLSLLIVRQAPKYYQLFRRHSQVLHW
jgi:hypothetical protein